MVWWIALASGHLGGTLAPILLISSCSGALAGELLHHFVPAVSPTTFALVAMAATFGAATRAPFAAIVFVFELTRDYDAILPLMGATVLADMIARSLMRESLMTEKLARRRRQRTRRVPARRDVHDTVNRDHDHRRGCHARRRRRSTMPSTGLGAGRHGAYPVIDDDGLCIGVVAAPPCWSREPTSKVAELRRRRRRRSHPTTRRSSCCSG